ncbi:MAG: hypothetical protein CVV07_12460 [Gammaproteobacteria bacterium HGW-Gammaproteobacteria-11]|nr:MAG: hypothetical protein CVV07_12460 [Gammaproteobacteria bacterium HGW-Gammaproteobacteria-11]
MQDDLDTQLRRHYQCQRLSDEDINGIQQAGRARRWLRWQAPWSWATAFTLVLALAITTILSHTESDETAQWLVADIAKNHLAGKPDNLAEGDLLSLAVEMERLGLGFALPADLELHGRVVGARLCSLAGKPAIHLYLDSQGEEKSLFVAAASHSLASVAHELDLPPGLSVEAWSEQDHFFALAKNY